MAIRGLLALALALHCFAGGPVRGGELRSEVARLFELGEPLSLRALEQATDQFQSIAKSADSDWRAEYAFVLVLAHQRKYSDALSRIEPLCEKHPQELELQRTHVWLELLLRKYPAALADISKLARLLPADPSDPVESQRAAELAEFIGRMTAYLEGPVGAKIKATLVQRERDKLVERLPESLRSAFERGMEDVRKIHQELEEEVKQERAGFTAAEEQALAKERAALASELAEKKADRDKIEKKGEATSKRSEDKLSEVNSRGQSVESQLASLQAAAAPLVADLENAWRQSEALRSEAAAAYAQMQALSARAADLERQGNRGDAARLRNEAAQLSSVASQCQRGAMFASSSARRLQARLIPLQSQAMQLTGQHSALLGERASLLDRADREQQALEDKAEDLEQETSALKKRVAAAAKKKPAKSNSRLRVLTTQKESLSTYEELPYEAEKDRLLAALAPGPGE